MNNEKRGGNFTSSQIYRLLGSPAVRKTYIQEKTIERKLNSVLDSDAHSQAIAWGSFLEQFAHAKLPSEFQLISNQTFIHPEYTFWSGTPDATSFDKLAEIKCYQKKKFSLYTDAILLKDIDVLRKEFSAEYWQIVSNCAILGLEIGLAVSYMPFDIDMPSIREKAINYDGLNQWKYRFIYENEDDNLPVLKKGGYYNDINIFEFEIPKEDIEKLTLAVISAEKELTINY